MVVFIGIYIRIKRLECSHFKLPWCDSRAAIDEECGQAYRVSISCFRLSFNPRIFSCVRQLILIWQYYEVIPSRCSGTEPDGDTLRDRWSWSPSSIVVLFIHGLFAAFNGRNEASCYGSFFAVLPLSDSYMSACSQPRIVHYDQYMLQSFLLRLALRCLFAFSSTDLRLLSTTDIPLHSMHVAKFPVAVYCSIFVRFLIHGYQTAVFHGFTTAFDTYLELPHKERSTEL
jgi:hypothetical protein